MITLSPTIRVGSMEGVGTMNGSNMKVLMRMARSTALIMAIIYPATSLVIFLALLPLFFVFSGIWSNQVDYFVLTLAFFPTLSLR